MATDLAAQAQNTFNGRGLMFFIICLGIFALLLFDGAVGTGGELLKQPYGAITEASRTCTS